MISGIMDEDEMTPFHLHPLSQKSEDWNLICSRKGQEKRKSGRNEGSRVDSQTRKRGLEGNSSEEDNRVVPKKIVREEYKVILKFGKEDEHIHLSPIVLSRELKKKLGEVDTA